jgi:hypothetical protein
MRAEPCRSKDANKVLNGDEMKVKNIQGANIWVYMPASDQFEPNAMMNKSLPTIQSRSIGNKPMATRRL